VPSRDRLLFRGAALASLDLRRVRFRFDFEGARVVLHNESGLREMARLAA
jgi:hypothetical protein